MTPTRLAEDAAAFLPVAFRLADAARAGAEPIGAAPFRLIIPVHSLCLFYNRGI